MLRYDIFLGGQSLHRTLTTDLHSSHPQKLWVISGCCSGKSTLHPNNKIHPPKNYKHPKHCQVFPQHYKSITFNRPNGPNISTYRKQPPSNTGTPLYHTWVVCEESIRAIVGDLSTIPLLQATMTTRSISWFKMFRQTGIHIDLHSPAGRMIIPADPFSTC